MMPWTDWVAGLIVAVLIVFGFYLLSQATGDPVWKLLHR